MTQYFEEFFDAECIVEFFNRIYRTYQWEPASHDFRYIEQDIPLASNEDIDKIAKRLLEREKMYNGIDQEEPINKHIR